MLFCPPLFNRSAVDAAVCLRDYRRLDFCVGQSYHVRRPGTASSLSLERDSLVAPSCTFFTGYCAHFLAVPPADDVLFAVDCDDHDDQDDRADLRNAGRVFVASESSFGTSLLVVELSASASDTIAGSAMDAMNGASKSSQNLLRLGWVDDIAFVVRLVLFGSLVCGA